MNNIADSCQEKSTTSNPSNSSRNMYSLFMREYWLIEIYSSYLTIFCILNLFHLLFCSLLQTIIGLPTKKARLDNIVYSCQEHSTTSNPSNSSRNMYFLFMREDWLIKIYSSDLTIFCILNLLHSLFCSLEIGMWLNKQ